MGPLKSTWRRSGGFFREPPRAIASILNLLLQPRYGLVHLEDDGLPKAEDGGSSGEEVASKHPTLMVRHGDVGVDEDLDYIGKDAEIVEVFTEAIRCEGWKVLPLAQPLPDELQTAVDKVLTLLGFEGYEPTRPVPRSSATSSDNDSILERFGINLSLRVQNPQIEPTIGREEEIDEVTSSLFRWRQPRLPIIFADSGVGKTNLLHAVARRLRTYRPEIHLIAIDMGRVLAGTEFGVERDQILVRLLTELIHNDNIVVAMERMDLTVSEIGYGYRVLGYALDHGLRLIGTALTHYRLSFVCHPLTRRLNPVVLQEPTPDETVEILTCLHRQIADHHHIDFDKTCITACRVAADPLEGHFPAKAIALLDAAGAQVRLAGKNVMRPDDIYAMANRWQAWNETESDDTYGS